jgi:hypothetical protein
MRADLPSNSTPEPAGETRAMAARDHTNSTVALESLINEPLISSRNFSDRN